MYFAKNAINIVEIINNIGKLQSNVISLNDLSHENKISNFITSEAYLLTSIKSSLIVIVVQWFLDVNY